MYIYIYIFMYVCMYIYVNICIDIVSLRQRDKRCVKVRLSPPSGDTNLTLSFDNLCELGYSMHMKEKMEERMLSDTRKTSTSRPPCRT